jgi:hypothetical protein
MLPTLTFADLLNENCHSKNKKYFKDSERELTFLKRECQILCKKQNKNNQLLFLKGFSVSKKKNRIKKNMTWISEIYINTMTLHNSPRQAREHFNHFFFRVKNNFMSWAFVLSTFLHIK